MKDRIDFKMGLTRLWWIPLVTGLLGLGLGIWCLCDPKDSIMVFSYVFAGLMCAAGLLNIVYAIVNNNVSGSNWGWSLALGIIEVLCGIWLFTLPQSVLMQTFMFVVGVWILVVAINSICETCVMSQHSPGWIVWMILLLLATLFFGFVFLSGPIAGDYVVWLYLGISLITFGGYRIALAAQLRSINRRSDGLL